MTAGLALLVLAAAAFGTLGDLRQSARPSLAARAGVESARAHDSQ
jgi:hypothetical protein